MIKEWVRGQVSESLPTALLLTLSGGFQDAYTYYFRDKVFANAQTGNIVIMGYHIMDGDWNTAFRYLLPVLAFVAGIYVSETIRGLFKEYKHIHWRQVVILIEILMLFSVGFFPHSMDTVANITISFVCAMQVQTFRKIKGNAYASTMCIGNLRSATEMLYHYRHTKDKESLEKSIHYYGIILFFAIGAAAGCYLTPFFAEKTIWFSSSLLIVAFLLMFVEGKENVG
jgi:uncharacterized membrane protein YoaK (UPF0700 family)